MLRREFLVVSAWLMTGGGRPFFELQPGGEMYGLIGKITAVAGKRDELIAILVNATGEMPGCLSYIVAKDAGDADAIWVSEVWDGQSSHQASLALPAVKEAIAKGRPLIVGFSNRVVTTPVGGVGLLK